MDEELRSAILAAKEGDENRARLILAEFLRRDPDNVAAWVLLSRLAASDMQKAAFLRKVLDLDPRHAYARQALEEMGQAPAPVVSQQVSSDPAPEDAGAQLTPAGDADYDELDEQFEDEPFEEWLTGAGEPSAEAVDSGPLAAMPAESAASLERDVPSAGYDWEQSEPEEAAPELSPLDSVEDADDDELPEWLRDDEGAEWLDEQTEARYAGQAAAESEAEKLTASEKEARLSAAMAARTPTVVPEPDAAAPNWLLALLIVIALIIFLVLIYMVVTNYL